MALVQVSRITNRKGLTENLPQLAGAEFGWCIDTRRLFIGNGTLTEGAPVIGNTEILTEFSDIPALSQYTYQDSAVGYIAQTGPTLSNPVVRTVQDKLDDFASVRDFGAVGDGVTDDTDAINRALYQLYCRETNTQIRRSLFFPAGTYLVSDTIVVPSYAKLVGEGLNSSIIQLAADSTAAYVAQYGDSLQQTGVNIGNNGATAPTDIEISAIAFKTLVKTDVFLVEDASQCFFDAVMFGGPLTVASITADQAVDDIAGVRFASTLAIVCTQVIFDKCSFTGLTYGINTAQQIQGVTVSNSKFDTLYQGIVLGDGGATNGGASGFRAVSNLFDSIYAEGVLYDQVVNNVSAYNIFYDVGNSYTVSPTTPIVRFGYDNNVSVSDMFERIITDSNTYPRIEITGTATTTGSAIQIGRYSRQSGRTFTLSNNVSNQTIFTTSASLVKAYRMDYTLTRSTGIRHGALTVVSQDTGDSSLTLSTTEDYTENVDAGVTFSVVQSGTTVTVRYTTTNTGSSGTLTYSLAQLA